MNPKLVEVAVDVAAPGATLTQQPLPSPAAGSPRLQHSRLPMPDVWRSLSRSSKALLLLGASQSLTFTVFAITRFSEVGFC